MLLDEHLDEQAGMTMEQRPSWMHPTFQEGEGLKPFWGEHETGGHPHGDVTDAIIGAAIQVRKASGPGLLEEPTRTCLAHRLREKGHKVLREVRLDLSCEGLHIPHACILDRVRAWPLKEGLKRVVSTRA